MSPMQVSRMGRGRSFIAICVVASLAAACAGPRAPLDVGAKEVALDILLGAKAKRVAEAPLPPLELPVVGGRLAPSLFASPVLRGGSTPPSELGPCPEADPLEPARMVANNVVSAPPVPATYTYRTVGRFKVGGASAQDVLLPPTSTVVVEKVVSEPQGWTTFDMVVTTGTASTTTTYRIVPNGAAAPRPDATGAYATVRQNVGPDVPPYPGKPAEDIARPNGGLPSGLYIAKVASTGSPVPFTPPAPGLAVAIFPLDIGTVFDAAASDGSTTMSYRSTLTQKTTVDACGTPLDAYQIDLSSGKVATAGSQESLDFTATYIIGTQFGGLPLVQVSKVTGTQGINPVERTVSLTINREPTTR